METIFFAMEPPFIFPLLRTMLSRHTRRMLSEDRGRRSRRSRGTLSLRIERYLSFPLPLPPPARCCCSVLALEEEGEGLALRTPVADSDFYLVALGGERTTTVEYGYLHQTNLSMEISWTDSFFS